MLESPTLKNIDFSAPLIMFGGKFPNYTFDVKAYQQGIEDGKRDVQLELIKMGKALFKIAADKINSVIKDALSVSEEKSIDIVEIHTKFYSWDDGNCIILVKIDDYIDEKIDYLYDKMRSATERVNDDSFNMDYSITYSSESLNRERLLSDGFQLIYDRLSSSRATQ